MRVPFLGDFRIFFSRKKIRLDAQIFMRCRNLPTFASGTIVAIGFVSKLLRISRKWPGDLYSERTQRHRDFW